MTDEPLTTGPLVLARRWLVNQRSMRGESGEWFDASQWADPDAFDERLYRMSDDPETAWHVVMAMWWLAESEADRRAIAVGPLEDLFRRHGAELRQPIQGFDGRCTASTRAVPLRSLSSAWVDSNTKASSGQLFEGLA